MSSILAGGVGDVAHQVEEAAERTAREPADGVVHEGPDEGLDQLAQAEGELVRELLERALERLGDELHGLLDDVEHLAHGPHHALEGAADS
ncbi:MAG: hypothetical protein QM765_09600 [Myxococcales bacterium]